MKPESPLAMDEQGPFPQVNDSEETCTYMEYKAVCALIHSQTLILARVILGNTNILMYSPIILQGMYNFLNLSLQAEWC